MILEKIRLHPFAGVADKEYLFVKGLNVICGPNEAGKSTLVKALTAALFEKTNLTPAKERDFLEELLPITGGDTIRVDLKFSIGGKKYILKKSWGGTRSSRLIAEGADISNDTKVQEELEQLLLLNEATYRNILITYQSELGRTVQHLQSNRDVSNSMAELLRNSVMQQDGVPVELLKQKLNKTLEDYFGNWDIAAERPKNNRDIEYPYINGNGLVIESYYQYRRLGRDLEKAVDFEQKLDKLVLDLQKYSQVHKELNEFLEKNKVAVSDAKVREKIELEQKSIKELYQQLTEIYEKWPALEQQQKNLNATINEERKREEALNKENEIAKKKESAKDLKQQYEQVVELQVELGKLLKKKEKIQKISEADVAKAEQLDKTLNDLKIKIEAQKLKLHISARKKIKGQLQQGLDEPKPLDLEQNESFKENIQGKFTFETTNLFISVESGNADISALINELNTTKAVLSAHYKKLNSADISDLKIKYKESEQLDLQINQLKSNLETVLKGTSDDSLKQQYQELEKLPEVRSADKLNEELIEVKAKIRSFQSEQLQVQQELRNMEERHISKAELMKRLVRGEQKKADNEEKLSQLKPVPKDFDSAEEFIREYERKDEQHDVLKDKIYQLQIQRADLEKEQPLQSVEELKEAIIAAEAEYKRRKDEGDAYIKIKEKLNELLEVMDQQTFQPLQKAVNKYISAITDQKYMSLNLDETMPASLKNGVKELDVRLLSKGTMDAAALSLKLGMADIYLKEREGFLLLDDPLVDMDPKRQHLAATVIQEYSKQRQVIILTCHPAHAVLLKKDYQKMEI